MKVPPKRKGKPPLDAGTKSTKCLNESPSEKEGKVNEQDLERGVIAPQ